MGSKLRILCIIFITKTSLFELEKLKMVTFLGNKTLLPGTEAFKVLTFKKWWVHLIRLINSSTNNNSMLRYCLIPLRPCTVHKTKDNEWALKCGQILIFIYNVIRSKLKYFYDERHMTIFTMNISKHMGHLLKD